MQAQRNIQYLEALIERFVAQRHELTCATGVSSESALNLNLSASTHSKYIKETKYMDICLKRM